MAYTINDLAGDEQALLGQNISIEAIPQRLFYPKQEMSTLEAGSFGLLSVDVSEIKDGNIPECFNIGWGVGERFYNITVKGKLPRLMPDVHYSIIATLVSHPQYGLSYQIVEMNRTNEIKTVDEEKEFIYYVFGNELAEVFYAVFDNPFKLFIGNTDKAIEELSRIRGIKYKKAIKLLEKFKKNAPNFKAIVCLQGKYGLSPLAVSSLVAQYKSVDTVIAKIEENPYVLTEVDGWGFARCDKVALAKGISVESPFRIEAFVRHDLNQIFDGEGHTWVLLDRLAQDIRTIAPNIENKKLSAYFQDWVYNHDWLYYDKQTKRIGLRKYYTLEYNIAEEFKRLLTAPVAMYDRQAFANVIKECEKENGWEYTEEQKTAIYGCMNNNVYIITGRAGVGKSSVVKPISKYVKKFGLSLGQVALAGKAASNLSEATGEEGSTIHRFLGYRPEDGFLHDKNTPLKHDVIVLDELSLVGLDLFYRLIQAVKDGAHLIMLGDHCQLESIGGAAILRDCLECNVVPSTILTKIHRQAQRSAIITESLKVSDGQQIVSNTPVTEVRGELKDLKVVTYNSSEESQMKFIGEYKKLLEIGILPNDILGVVPMKSRGSLSCLNLNKEIQKIVNGDEEKPSIKVKNPDGEYELRLGDKVVNCKNHYDTESTNGDEMPIYNGNVGYITEVNKSYIVVDFTQWGRVVVPKDYVSDINLGYVMTIHKCVSGETWVLTQNGYLKIKNIQSNNQIGWSNCDEKIYTPEGFVNVKEFYHSKSNLLKIITSYNHTVEVTPDHFLTIINQDGCLEQIQADKLKPSDTLIESFNENFYVNCTDLTPYFNIRPSVKNHTKSILLPSILNEDFSLFIGMMCADGYINKSKTQISYAKKFISCHKKFAEIIKNVFGVKPIFKPNYGGKNKTCHYSFLSSSVIYDFLFNIGGMCPNNKYVPEIIMKTTKTNQQSFLRGLFEDGSITPNGSSIKYTTKNKEMIDAVFIMLKNMGIIGSLTQTYDKRYGNTVYNLGLSGKFARKFCEEIGFVSDEKNARVLRVLKKAAIPSEKDTYPNLVTIIQKILGRYNLSKSIFPKKKTRDLISLNSSSLSTYRLREILKILKENIPQIIFDADYKILQKLITNYIPVKIKNISTISSNDVFCFHVPKTHQFIQNGFIGSNCQGSQAPYVIFGIDMVSYPLLSRELEYTALTRARKYCVLCGQISAIRKATTISRVSKKQTFLKELLRKSIQQS